MKNSTHYNHKRLLYLIRHSNNQMFKIGIATDNGRFHQIDKDYSINWDNSLYFEGENDYIKKIERLLHIHAMNYRLDPQNGTGGTEWFNVDCMELVVNQVLICIDVMGFDLNPKFYDIDLMKIEDEKSDIEVITEKVEKEEKPTQSWLEYKQSIFNKYPKTITDKWEKLDNQKTTTLTQVDKMNELIPEFMLMAKPSELCQVLYVDKEDKTFAYLSPIEIDLINLILYKSREEIIKNKINLDGGNFTLELLLKDISDVFNKYTATGYEPLITNFRNLRNKEVVINALNKNKEMETTYTSIIHKIKISKHKNSKLKKIILELDNEIIGMMLNVKKMFSTMFFKIQFNLDLKYSKLLYEILRDYLGKDYNGVKSRIIEVDMLLGLLNVKNLNRYTKFSFFNGEILKKAVKEINEKSDIIVSYAPIKERTDDNPRLHVTKVKFNMEKQSDERLKALGLLNQEPELSIEEQIHQNKLNLKSRIKLDKFIKTGYEVKDEEAWIKTDVKKNEKLYTAQYRLDDYLNELEELSQEDRRDVLSDLAKFMNANDPIVLINKNYLIEDLSGNSLTSSAIETREIIMKLQKNQE